MAWEREAERAQEHGVRVVRVRTGIVLARHGGALPQMALPVKLFAGGPIGGGRQWIPWIHLDDEVGLLMLALDDAGLRGPMNGTAPEPVRQRDFVAALGRALNRPTILPTPAFPLRIAMGEMATLALDGQRAVPTRRPRGGLRLPPRRRRGRPGGGLRLSHDRHRQHDPGGTSRSSTQIAAALIAIGLIAGALSPRVRAAFAGVLEHALPAGRLARLRFTAAVATGGSLFFSQVAHFPPCQYCWYQRICMYPLSIILLVGALLKDRRVPLYAAVFPLVGAVISIYHIYIEVNPDKESASCKAGIPCSTRWIDEFGYVTIPVMALSGFALIAVLLVVAWVAGRRGADEDGAPAA